MSESTEQKGFPPRIEIRLTKEIWNPHDISYVPSCRISIPCEENSPVFDKPVTYLSLSEANALLSEAVRVARTGMLKEMEQTVSKAAACGNLQGNIIRAFLQRFKAASTEEKP